MYVAEAPFLVAYLTDLPEYFLLLAVVQVFAYLIALADCWTSRGASDGPYGGIAPNHKAPGATPGARFVRGRVVSPEGFEPST